MFPSRLKAASVARFLVSILVFSLLQFGFAVQSLPVASAASFGSSSCTSDFSDTTNLVEVTLANYCVVKITLGTTTWTPPAGVQSFYLLAVGGGGGGAHNVGGGGGGGAVIYGNVSLGSATTITSTVGSGGAGGYRVDGTTLSDGQNGSSTTVTATGSSLNVVANGGNGGQTHWSDNYCPGGSFILNYASGGTVGSTTGMTAITSASGASGGGNNASSSAGGTGTSISITSSAYKYGAGGGAGAWGSGAGGGGADGGGAGQSSGGGSGSGGAGASNSGSGGGGGMDGCGQGGAGGSGVVILKWIPIPVVATPAGASSLVNRVATFTTTVTSSTTLTKTYQWGVSTNSGSSYSAVSDGSGGTTLTYTTSVNSAAKNGNLYRAGATFADGTISSIGYSAGGILTVNAPPGSDTDTALALSGSTQYADVADSTGSVFDITGTFTLQAWVKPSTSCSSGGVVVSKRSYMLYCQDGVWKVMILANGLGGSGVPSDIAVEPNEWHHLAITKSSSGGNVLFYYDGLLVQTISTGVAAMTPNDSPFEIGRYSVLGYYFQGQIDEVILYNTQRSQSQISSDMKSYSSISDAALVAYYDFNEGSGTTLYNRDSGATSATDLTISGSPTWNDVKSIDTLTLPAYTILKFTRTYITATGGWKVPSGITRITALVVAGGGGGGSRHGGGGGAGGLAYAPAFTVLPQTNYQVVVGSGGRGYGQLGNGNYTGALGASTGTDSNGSGFNGSNSLVGRVGVSESITAIGGGGGSASNVGGGSSGGTSTSSGNSTVGPTTQYSTSYFTGFGNLGGQGYSGVSCGNDFCGGGGGGAGGPGGIPILTPDSTSAGVGGAGKLYSISGEDAYYAGGGGGSSRNATRVAAGGSSIGGAGGKASQGLDAVENTGSGGGGGGHNSTISYRGGNGSFGVVVIRWITASKPIFTQPTYDTTTAGLIDTITVSADPISPLTRNYRWQSSSDTGTTWENISIGSGFTSQTYSTPTLETTTSGIRYQYRVIVTDSDTVGLSITDTSSAVYLTINPRISISGVYTSQKYGATHTDTFTVVSGTGTGNKTFTFTPNNRSGITWNGATANQATLTLARTLGPGTYYETMTATDTKGATTQYGLAIIVGKADTITVTSLARSDTYTGSALSFAPGYTITGLQNSDTVTSISWSYSGIENSASSFGPSATKPVNAGSYQITPTSVISNSDSYTAVTHETSTLTINRATRTISGSISPSPLKFGSTGALSSTISAGSSEGSVTYVSSTTDSCTVSATNLQALKSTGSCAFTARISRGNNYETATSESVSINLIKADTLTVSVNAISPLTYTGSPAAVSPGVTVSGLVLSNSVGSNPVTINYEGPGASGASCAQGGPCAVGDTGPGGGKVFYVATTQQSWGRYLEAAPANWSGGADNQASNVTKWCQANPSIDGTTLSGFWNGLGYGYSNTYDTRLNVCTGGAIYNARAYRGGGFSNWYVPNNTELEIMAESSIRTLIGLVNDSSKWGYWGSYQAGNTGYIGSLVTATWAIGETIKGESAKNYMRPIRAFSDGDVAITTYSSPPTDAGTYAVKASALTLSSGSTSDYQNVVYTDASLLINRAQQRPLNIFMYGGVVGSPYLIWLQGGNGTGAVTESLTGISSVTGCNVNNHYLSASEQKQGFCEVRVVKAGDRNYFSETQTVQMYFMAYLNNLPSGQSGSGSTIALNGKTSLTIDDSSTVRVPRISGFTLSGSTLTINGEGFGNSSVTVTFERYVNAATNPTPTLSGTVIVVAVPGSAISGPVLVITAGGRDSIEWLDLP